MGHSIQPITPSGSSSARETSAPTSVTGPTRWTPTSPGTVGSSGSKSPRGRTFMRLATMEASSCLQTISRPPRCSITLGTKGFTGRSSSSLKRPSRSRTLSLSHQTRPPGSSSTGVPSLPVARSSRELLSRLTSDLSTQEIARGSRTPASLKAITRSGRQMGKSTRSAWWGSRWLTSGRSGTPSVLTARKWRGRSLSSTASVQKKIGNATWGSTVKMTGMDPACQIPCSKWTTAPRKDAMTFIMCHKGTGKLRGTNAKAVSSITISSCHARVLNSFV